MVMQLLFLCYRPNCHKGFTFTTTRCSVQLTQHILTFCVRRSLRTMNFVVSLILTPGNSMSNHPIFFKNVTLMSQISLKFWPMLDTDEISKSWKFHGHSSYGSRFIAFRNFAQLWRWAQNPPFWIYILFNKSGTNGPTIMKFGT